MNNEVIFNKIKKSLLKINYNIYGILDGNNCIHTLGTDSKIIGRVFEMLTQPLLEKIAKDEGILIETPTKQTLYPDFILMDSNDSKSKIAIDIKSTYIDIGQPKIKFTLGSFGSYMRNNTKNIQYKYTDYSEHYVIGFVYERNGNAQESKVYNIEDRYKIELPYKEVKSFIQEKYKIAGDKPGSGNTENIGSIMTTNFDDFVEGRGPFSKLGKEAYEIYWRYYPAYRSVKKPYTSLKEFKDWIKQIKVKPELFFDYDFDKLKEDVSMFDC